MKFKISFFFSVFCFFFTFSLFSENLQIVMPKLIYIGDTVEIRYVFHSDMALFGGDFAEKPSVNLALRSDYDFFKAHENEFMLKSAFIEKRNSEYALFLSLIPFRTGELLIPPFNLSNLVNFSQTGEKFSNQSAPPFIVKLSSIEVKSLLAKTGNRDFMPAANPRVMPGTTALIAFLIILSIILFGALIFVLLHFPKIAHFVENALYLYSLKKNSRKTIKKILELQKKSAEISSDKDFSEILQHILRKFLTKRFAQNFSSITTNRIFPLFSELCGGELSEKQNSAVENLISLFRRLDFIRFSENAKFMTKNETNESERDILIKNSIQIIEDFDTDSADDSGDGK